MEPSRAHHDARGAEEKAVGTTAAISREGGVDDVTTAMAMFDFEGECPTPFATLDDPVAGKVSTSFSVYPRSAFCCMQPTLAKRTTSSISSHCTLTDLTV